MAQEQIELEFRDELPQNADDGTESTNADAITRDATKNRS